jgi:hypothetical protein
MKRTTLLKIRDLSRSKEDEKMKKMGKEEEIEEMKRNKEAKIHCLRIPLLGQRHRRRGRFIQRNFQQERKCVLISLS